MPAVTLTPGQLTGWFSQQVQDATKATKQPAQLRALALKARADVQSHFDKSQAPDGTPWKPLAFQRVRGGNKPLLDTGKLRASISANVSSDGITVGTQYAFAGIHNTGGVIRPVRAKFLAIPLTLEALRAGSPRRFPRTLFFQGSGAKGALMEAKGKGKKKTLVSHYALVRKVTIPKREFLGFSQAFLAFAERMIADLMGKQVAK